MDRSSPAPDCTRAMIRSRWAAPYTHPTFYWTCHVRSTGAALTTRARNLRMQSALRIGASKDGSPAMRAGVVTLQLVKSFATGRTKANVNPPATLPQITGADT